jgi:6-phospho-3-hexuloisomerase
MYDELIIMSYAYMAMREIASFIMNAIDIIRKEDIEEVSKTLIEAYNNNKKVLVMGAGRSGLVGKAFAIRLMHLGFNSYVLGDTIIPPIGKDDVVVAISGSGTTELIVTAAEAAKRVGAKIIAVTSYPSSPLGKLANVVLFVPGRTKVAVEKDYFSRQILGIHEPLAPLGTLFEDTAMVVLDGMIVELMYKLGKEEKELKNRHANIEI